MTDTNAEPAANATYRSVGTISIDMRQDGHATVWFTPDQHHSAKHGKVDWAVFAPVGSPPPSLQPILQPKCDDGSVELGVAQDRLASSAERAAQDQKTVEVTVTCDKAKGRKLLQLESDEPEKVSEQFPCPHQELCWREFAKRVEQLPGSTQVTVLDESASSLSLCSIRIPAPQVPK